MAQIFPIDFEEKLTIANGDYILFSDSEDGDKIKKAQYSNLKGETGATGNGISTITSSKVGKTTTVTITETDGTVDTFTVEDGADGQGAGDVVGPASSTDGDIVLFDGATGKLIKDGNKKISDFATSTQGGKADTAVQPGDLSTVATTGSYTDLSNKPTIPTVNDGTLTITQNGTSKGTFTANQSTNKTIALTDTTYTAGTGLALNGTEFSNSGVTSFNGSTGDISYTAPVTSVNGSTGAVTGLQTTSNLKTSLTDDSDTYYPSQKAVKTAVDAKQDTLVSGTNIKTVNNESLLGTGNVSISEVPSGGTNGDVLTNVSGTPTWQAPSGGDVVVSSDADNVLTTGTGLRAGDESDLPATPDSNCLYFCY